MLSILLRFTDSDYPFSIFKLFLHNVDIKHLRHWTCMLNRKELYIYIYLSFYIVKNNNVPLAVEYNVLIWSRWCCWQIIAGMLLLRENKQFIPNIYSDLRAIVCYGLHCLISFSDMSVYFSFYHFVWTYINLQGVMSQVPYTSFVVNIKTLLYHTRCIFHSKRKS